MHPTHDGDHGLIFFLVISWACEREQVNMSKAFLEYFADIDKMFGKYYLTRHKIFGDVEEYFATCSWINDIYGWKFGWQVKMDELFHEHWQ